jgi:precorrin-8X/cobalt-precorrin-8 methylmutase
MIVTDSDPDRGGEPAMTRAGPARVHPHPIEVESYALLRSRLDTCDLPPLSRAVVERVVHTTADLSWAGELVCNEQALQAGRAALLDGVPLITDVRMLAAGVTSRPCTVALDIPGVAELAASEGLTRSAAGIRLAAAQHPEAAVWAIGNAPTALVELLRCARTGQMGIPLVVGVPVGFVGAVLAKSTLRESGLNSVTNRTERGGAAIAAAIVNALLYSNGPR